MVDYMNRYKEQLLDIITSIIPNCKIYLFGSRASGDASPGSDIDLALDAGSKIDFKEILQMQVKIDETAIPLSVDLVDIHNVSEDFRREIEKERVVWKS